MGVLGAIWVKGLCDIDLNELVFTFGGSYVCASFGENRSRNATVRVLADEHNDRRKPIL